MDNEEFTAKLKAHTPVDWASSNLWSSQSPTVYYKYEGNVVDATPDKHYPGEPFAIWDYQIFEFLEHPERFSADIELSVLELNDKVTRLEKLLEDGFMPDSVQLSADGYMCSYCGVVGVKLWRRSNSNSKKLFCEKCGEEKQANKRVNYQIGNLEPAIPVIGGIGYYSWYHTVIPEDRAKWWSNLGDNKSCEEYDTVFLDDKGSVMCKAKLVYASVTFCQYDTMAGTSRKFIQVKIGGSVTVLEEVGTDRHFIKVAENVWKRMI